MLEFDQDISFLSTKIQLHTVCLEFAKNVDDVVSFQVT